MRTIRSDCAVADLTEAQRDQLCDWVKSFGYAKALELAAKPVSEDGLDFRVHRTTLVRFFRKEQKERHRRELAEIAATAVASPDQNLPGEAKELIAHARGNFAHALYELSSESDVPENFDRLAVNLHRLDAHRLREQMLLLEQERIALVRERVQDQRLEFEFNAAREILNHISEYIAIYKNPQTDNEEKIWQVRSTCFGKTAPRSQALAGGASENPPLSPQAERSPDTFDTLSAANLETSPLTPPNVSPTSERSAHLHAAASENPPLSPHPSSLSPERSTQIHAVQKNQLQPSASGVQPSEKLSPPCPPKLHAKEGNLGPEPQRNPDTVVNTSSHSAANDTPLGPPGSRPASDHSSLISEKSTQIHAAPESTLQPSSFSPQPSNLRNPDTIVYISSQSAPNASPSGSIQNPNSKLQNQSTQIHVASENPLSPPSSSLSPEASRPARSLDPKPPAAWLAAARHPADLRRYFAAQHCGHSPVRLKEFLASPDPVAIPTKILQSFDELP